VRAISGLLAFSLACGALGCGKGSGGDEQPPQDADAGADADTEGGPTQVALANVEQGQQSVVSRKCVDCHTQSLAGQLTPIPYPQDPRVKLFPPNLTPDNDTGLGTWTDNQIANAIRNGQDKDGLELCPEMSHFADMNDYETYSIVKYLKSVPAVHQVVPGSICPPLKDGDGG
jgi:hypothetical protein